MKAKKNMQNFINKNNIHLFLSSTLKNTIPHDQHHYALNYPFMVLLQVRRVSFVVNKATTNLQRCLVSASLVAIVLEMNKHN